LDVRRSWTARRDQRFGAVLVRSATLSTPRSQYEVGVSLGIVRTMDARVTVAGFIIFIVASIAWMVDGWLETKASLVIQNVILLLINVIGVWRSLPKAEKEVKS
jgi:hypothetical protein